VYPNTSQSIREGHEWKRTDVIPGLASVSGPVLKDTRVHASLQNAVFLSLIISFLFSSLLYTSDVFIFPTQNMKILCKEKQ
jgi:hypothetical protein